MVKRQLSEITDEEQKELPDRSLTNRLSAASDTNKAESGLLFSEVVAPEEEREEDSQYPYEPCSFDSFPCDEGKQSDSPRNNDADISRGVIDSLVHRGKGKEKAYDKLHLYLDSSQD